MQENKTDSRTEQKQADQKPDNRRGLVIALFVFALLLAVAGIVLIFVAKAAPADQSASRSPESSVVTTDTAADSAQKIALWEQDGTITYYKNQNEFLKIFGGKDNLKALSYKQTSDENGLCEHHVFFDPTTKKGCYLQCASTGNMGLALSEVFEQPYAPIKADDPLPEAGQEILNVPADPYILTAEELECTKSVSCKISQERNAQGKLTKICYTGKLDGNEKPDEIMSVSWSYRPDGTLESRSYVRAYQLKSTGFHQRIDYDTKGRPTDMNYYITSGQREKFYFYTGDQNEPDYALDVESSTGFSAFLSIYR